MLPSEEKIIALLQENAVQNIMPHFKLLQSHQIREKGPGNLVTDADESSEIFLTKYLSDMIPGSLVVGEEAVHKDAGILNNLLSEDQPVWIIDPIDGTYNFAHGRSKWGVFVSLYYKGETVFGILYDVLNDEFIFAKKGEGTHHRLKDGSMNQIKLKRPDKPIDQYCGHVGGAQAWHFKKIKPFCGEISNIRCSMHDFWTLMLGDIDFTFHTSTTPWDHSAPGIAVLEAGGFIAAGKDAEKLQPAVKQKHLLATYDEDAWYELAGKFHSVL